jgi:hypothetical protein
MMKFLKRAPHGAQDKAEGRPQQAGAERRRRFYSP